MKTVLSVLLLVVLSCPVMAQEVFVNGGLTRNVKTGTTAGQWSATYRQNGTLITG